MCVRKSVVGGGGGVERLGCKRRERTRVFSCQVGGRQVGM